MHEGQEAPNTATISFSLFFTSLLPPSSDQNNNVKVPMASAQSLADSWGVPYIECSSKTGDNIREVFHLLLKEIEKDGDLLGYESETLGGCNVI